MNCIYCGKEIENEMKPCNHCGAEQGPTENVNVDFEEENVVLEESTDVEDDATMVDSKLVENPVAPTKKKKGIIIGIAVLTVITLGILLISGVFSGPKAKVKRAITKSTKAYVDVYEKLSDFDYAKLIEEQTFSQTLNFKINEGYQNFAGSGFADGVKVDLDGYEVKLGCNVDIPNKKMDLSYVETRNDEVSLSATLGVYDNIIFVGSKELTEGKMYGINTSTLGADIAEFSGDDYLKDLSFNIYDLMDSIKDIEDEEAQKKVAEATEKLLDSIEVKKEGKVKVTINENEVKANRYQVVLKTSAIDDYLDDLEKAYDDGKSEDKWNEIIDSLGLPDDIREAIVIGNNQEDTESYFDVLHYIVDEMDDIEFDIYIGKGYVLCFEFDIEFEGEKATVRAEFGGNKQYVDDLTISFRVKGEYQVTLTSKGNHAVKGGTFTDKTTVVYKEVGGSKETLYSGELEYNKKSSELTAKIKLNDSTVVSLEGTMEMDKTSFNLQIDKLKVKCDDEYSLDCSVGYHLGEYKSSDIDESKIIMILDMTEDEIMKIIEKLSDSYMDMMGSLGNSLDSGVLY
ncbi:MAG: hypothetical protein IKV30_07535 [Clostridia bacterium]|nr:hypothetical protein [Clostridia bacterium]